MAETQRIGLNTSVDRNLINDYKAGIKSYSDAQKKSGGLLDTVGDIAGQAMSGIQAQRQQREIAEKAKREELKAYEDQYNKNAETISQNAGSLGTEYYNLAYEQAAALQEQYAEAVKSGDKKLQGDLKGQLNGLSTSVQALKGNLEAAQGIIKDENGNSSLSLGMNENQKKILAVCTDAKNIRYDNDELKWENPDFDGTDNTKQFYTQEDLNGSLELNDYDLQKRYIEHEKTFGPSGIQYQDGTKGSANFNAGRTKTQNLNFINEKNIASVMHDDIRGTGVDNSFSNNVKEYLDNTDYKSLGLDKIDWDNDGEVGDDDDLVYLEDMDTLHKIITDKTHQKYNFETSRGIIAEWMTSFQKKVFMGDMDPDLMPEPGQTRSEFIAAGGVMGMLADKNIIWSEDKDRFVFKNLVAKGSTFNKKS